MIDRKRLRASLQALWLPAPFALVLLRRTMFHARQAACIGNQKAGKFLPPSRFPNISFVRRMLP